MAHRRPRRSAALFCLTTLRAVVANIYILANTYILARRAGGRALTWDTEPGRTASLERLRRTTHAAMASRNVPMIAATCAGGQPGRPRRRAQSAARGLAQRSDQKEAEDRGDDWRGSS